MPLDETGDDLAADFAILETIGDHVDAMIDRLLARGVIQKTIRRWLVGHADLPDDDEARVSLAAMAADLELFTPAMSGRTVIERELRAKPAASPDERAAFQALSDAQFRLIKIIDRESPGLVRLEDLVTGESLLLLDERIAPMAAGLLTAMRLCPLASGRQVLISPLFGMDQTMLDEAMAFVRHGRPLGTGHRCAASLYRNLARRGFHPVPQMDELDVEELAELLVEAEKLLSPVQRLAIDWITSADPDRDLVFEARNLTSVENLVDALGGFALNEVEDDAPEDLGPAYEQIAALQVETMVQRVRAGLSGAADMLDRVAAEVAEHIAHGRMYAAARDLLERLRKRTGDAGAKPAGAGDSSSAAAIDRVIQRIQALRAKTADRGCTEAEAIAAAAKVSELLARHDLTLDEVSVRRSDCEGARVATGRKRRAPVDACAPAIAAFCDCRVWSEPGAENGLSIVFFGLKADVEAARFLHDLIEVTFETESTTFRRGAIYQALRGGDRRNALHSFQIGLASGIAEKLGALKAERQDGGAQSTGFDLVAIKSSVLDDEISRLGLHFTARDSSARTVRRDAYQAGRISGARFEPALVLERDDKKWAPVFAK